MTIVPHLPATCARCYARCNATEQTIALVVLKLLSDGPQNDQKWFIPKRTPICNVPEEAAREVEPLLDVK